MLLLFNFIRRFGLWRGAAAAEAVIIVFLAMSLVGLRYETARVVYLHPGVKTSESRTTRQEPSVIERKVYRMSWQDFAAANPDEAKKLLAAQPFGVVPFGGPVEVTEEKTTVGAKTESVASASDARPVPLSETISPRTDRWLLGAIVDHGQFKEIRGYSLMAGYSLRNRLDLMAGAGANGLKVEAVARF